MSSTGHFRLPIPTPSPDEARALAAAAIYLRRAATSLDSRRLGGHPFDPSLPFLNDLSGSLSAAGSLCSALLETAENR
jgi:hypothetical protein